MSQFFVQGGKTIEIPGPTYDGLPNSSAITPEFCDAVFDVFDDRNRFNEVGGWPALNEALGMPMVLVMSVWDDVRLPLPSRDWWRVWGGRNLTQRSTMPTCSGSTRCIPPRRRASPARRGAPARRTRASRRRSSLRCPMRTCPPCVNLSFVLTSSQAGCLVQHPLRARRLDRLGLGLSIHLRWSGWDRSWVGALDGKFIPWKVVLFFVYVEKYLLYARFSVNSKSWIVSEHLRYVMV